MSKRYAIGLIVATCLLAAGCGDLDPLAPTTATSTSSVGAVTPRDTGGWEPIPPGQDPCGPNVPTCGVPQPVPPGDPSPCQGAANCGIVFDGDVPEWYSRNH